MDNMEGLTSEEVELLAYLSPKYYLSSPSITRWKIANLMMDAAAIKLINRGFLRREPGADGLYTLTEKGQAIHRLICGRQ